MLWLVFLLLLDKNGLQNELSHFFLYYYFRYYHFRSRIYPAMIVVNCIIGNWIFCLCLTSWRIFYPVVSFTPLAWAFQLPQTRIYWNCHQVRGRLCRTPLYMVRTLVLLLIPLVFGDWNLKMVFHPFSWLLMFLLYP